MSAITFDRLHDRKRSRRNASPIASKVRRLDLRAIAIRGLKFAAGSIGVVALMSAIVALRIFVWWPAYAH